MSKLEENPNSSGLLSRMRGESVFNAAKDAEMFMDYLGLKRDPNWLRKRVSGTSYHEQNLTKMNGGIIVQEETPEKLVEKFKKVGKWIPFIRKYAKAIPQYQDELEEKIRKDSARKLESYTLLLNNAGFTTKIETDESTGTRTLTIPLNGIKRDEQEKTYGRVLDLLETSKKRKDKILDTNFKIYKETLGVTTDVANFKSDYGIETTLRCPRRKLMSNARVYTTFRPFKVSVFRTADDPKPYKKAHIVDYWKRGLTLRPIREFAETARAKTTQLNGKVQKMDYASAFGVVWA